MVAGGPMDSVLDMAATGFHSADELNDLLPGTLPGLLNEADDFDERGFECRRRTRQLYHDTAVCLRLDRLSLLLHRVSIGAS